MTQKTAVMLMIEMIESVRRDEPQTALWNLKKYAQELLATEKEQLIRAYKMYNEYYESGEQFYNQTYGQ